jgi:hypothetical protein
MFGFKPRKTFRIYHYMILIAFCPAIIFIYNAYDYYRGCTFLYGANTSVLNSGDLVVLIDLEGLDSHNYSIGSKFLVRSDPTDEDSAYPQQGRSRVHVEVIL